MNEELKLLEELENNLENKQRIFDELVKLIKEQMSFLDEGHEDVKAFNKVLQQKDRMYMKLEKIDKVINDQLVGISKFSGLKEEYPEVTGELVRKFNRLNETGQAVQKAESISKEKITKLFGKNKESVKKYRKTKGVLNQYAKNMNQGTDGNNYFMDKKK